MILPGTVILFDIIIINCVLFLYCTVILFVILFCIYHSLQTDQKIFLLDEKTLLQLKTYMVS